MDVIGGPLTALAIDSSSHMPSAFPSWQGLNGPRPSRGGRKQREDPEAGLFFYFHQRGLSKDISQALVVLNRGCSFRGVDLLDIYSPNYGSAPFLRGRKRLAFNCLLTWVRDEFRENNRSENLQKVQAKRPQYKHEGWIYTLQNPKTLYSP